MKKIGEISSFAGGIADGAKEGTPNSCQWERSTDFRSDARQLTILPKTTKISGTVVVDLPKWAERVGTDTYIAGEEGNIYKRTSANVWTKPHTAADASGNGLAYFGEDNYLYYTQDKTFGRFGPIGATNEEWYDDFLGSEGGAPTNTHSVDLESTSSQYASRADTASLSITGDITLEAYLKPESLPTTGNTMTIISKWDETGATRSYKMDVAPTSNFFGDGGDGAKTIAANTTDTPIDSACSGTISTKSLTATNASFAADQKILIHQTRGTGAGIWQITAIQAYTAGTITTTDNLVRSYSSTGSNKAQVLVLKEYTDVTVNSGKIWTAKVWNGTVGGILAFLASGDVTVTGTIMATGKGFRGGTGATGVDNVGHQGEGTEGAGSQVNAPNNNNGNGGGGGGRSGVLSHDGGAGGGNGTAGTIGYIQIAGYPRAEGGSVAGTADLTTMVFGGGGGQGHYNQTQSGGAGGGIVFLAGVAVTVTGSVISAGAVGQAATSGANGGCGGGAGGSVLIKAQTAVLGSTKITALGANGGTGSGGNTGDGSQGGNTAAGSKGGNGRIHCDYYTSVSGTTSPTLNSTQDDELASSDGYSLRLSVSDDGTDVDTLSLEIGDDIALATWARWAIAWDASASTAYFYKNSNLLGSDTTGAMTAIDDNASAFAIGMNTVAAAANFFDGKVDDVRVWNDIRTATELKRYNDFVLAGTEPGLVGYWKLDNDYTDSQADGNNDLTASGTPVFDADDIPFSGLTSRTDQDQALDTSGNTYTLTTAISEAATHRQTFVPAKDPQESVQVNIADTGTGDWTLTVHDALEREIVAKTVANAQLTTSDFEFIFDSIWRPVIGASYHFHLTSTEADGTVVTTDAGNLETADFHTYYQFLVTDADFHPAIQMLNFLAIGNGRYLAKWDATTYTPHKLTFPSGYRVRCLGFWREYLAIGTWKGTNIYDYDEGRIFFWDGIADTYNFYIDVPEGGINALLGTRGLLYIWAGYSGDMLIYSGGEAAQKVKRLPKVTTDKYVEIFPGAVSTWRSLIHFGVGGNSDSTVIEKGVYTWGSLNRNYAESFGYGYPLSVEARTGTDLKVGMVKASGQDLLIGWQAGASYGVDKVAVDNAPFATATYEALVADLGSVAEEKYPLILRTDFEPLVTGESITVKYKIDRESEWRETLVEDTVDADYVRLPIKAQAKEISVGLDLQTSVSTSPTVIGITLESEVEGERNA